MPTKAARQKKARMKAEEAAAAANAAAAAAAAASAAATGSSARSHSRTSSSAGVPQGAGSAAQAAAGTGDAKRDGRSQSQSSMPGTRPSEPQPMRPSSSSSSSGFATGFLNRPQPAAAPAGAAAASRPATKPASGKHSMSGDSDGDEDEEEEEDEDEDEGYDDGDDDYEYGDEGQGGEDSDYGEEDDDGLPPLVPNASKTGSGAPRAAAAAEAPVVDDRPPAVRAEDVKARGNAAYESKDYEKAVELYSEAIALCPQNHTYYGNRGAAYLAMKKFKEALEDSQKAVELDPTFLKGHVRISECHVQMGNFDAALQALHKDGALRHRSLASHAAKVTSLRSQFEEAKAYLDAGEFSRALQAAQALMGEMGDAVVLHVMLADCFLGLHRWAEALQVANGVFRSTNAATNRGADGVAGVADVLRVRGTALYYTGSTDLALKHLQEVLRTDPDNSKARVVFKRIRALEAAKARGTELFKQGRMAEAAAALTEALEIDPPNHDYNAALLNNRAAAYARLERWQEALDDCDAALRLRPGYAKAQLKRSECLVGLERFEEAIQLLDELLREDPRNQELRQRKQHAQVELKKSKRKDYYKILGVAKNATQPEIRRAYRAAAIQWHPDKNRGSPEEAAKAELMFKDINEAQGVLSDPQKRAQYDEGASIDEIEGNGGHGHGGFGGEPDLSQFFHMFGGGGGGGRRGFGW